MAPTLYDGSGNPIPETPQKERKARRRWSTRVKRGLIAVFLAIPVICALVAVGFQLKSAAQARERLSAAYPAIEKLVALYSLFTVSDTMIEVKSDTDYGSEEFTVNVGGNGSPAGALFDAFSSTRTIVNPFDGEQFEGWAIGTNEDIWYVFSCESLFGYELQVTVNPAEQSLYQWRDRIQNDQRARLIEELGDQYDPETWDFQTYAISVSGLSASGSFDFLLANGTPSWASNGTVRRRDGWVVYVDGDEPITVGELNRFLQVATRRLGIPETDLAKVAPQLETMWTMKDQAFLDAFVDELESVPDLQKLAALFE